VDIICIEIIIKGRSGHIQWPYWSLHGPWIHWTALNLQAQCQQWQFKCPCCEDELFRTLTQLIAHCDEHRDIEFVTYITLCNTTHINIKALRKPVI